MEEKQGCEFCECGKLILETRTLGIYTDKYVGIDVYIDADKNINFEACNEQKNGCSCYQDELVKINYCPMCGKEL